MCFRSAGPRSEIDRETLIYRCRLCVCVCVVCFLTASHSSCPIPVTHTSPTDDAHLPRRRVVDAATGVRWILNASLNMLESCDTSSDMRRSHRHINKRKSINVAGLPALLSPRNVVPGRQCCLDCRDHDFG